MEMFSAHLMAWPPKKIKRGTYVKYSTQFQNGAGPVSWGPPSRVVKVVTSGYSAQRAHFR